MATSENIAKEKTESPPTDPSAIAINDSKSEQQAATTNTDLESASPEDDSAPPARWQTANIILLVLAGLFSLSLLFSIIYTIQTSTAFKCSHPGLTLYTQYNYILLCCFTFIAVYEVYVPLSVLPCGGLRYSIYWLFWCLTLVVAQLVFGVDFGGNSRPTACGVGS